VYFGKLVFESDEQEFSLRGVKSKKISSHPGRDVLKVRNAGVEVEWAYTHVIANEVLRTGALKMREWKMQEWKLQEQTAEVEIAGVENTGAKTHEKPSIHYRNL